MPAGFIKNRLALPKAAVLIVPKMFDGLPPVTRLIMLLVAMPESLRKLAASGAFKLKLPKLWTDWFHCPASCLR